ncbi:sigma factor-like helix-turn-helix DNA-binding protein [Kineococcus sp. SYSU DK004]|uniref:sigma factor-like helix-turn-helix DNA-binding protein n=1 Tax=Kineococcus sp. SYSU DK004 TaxID=3383125 RepID=UPI003D7D29D6
MHPSTVRRHVAEPREDFLARARTRREQVLALRAQGLKMREIAEQTGIPLGTVGRVIAEAKKAAQTAQDMAQKAAQEAAQEPAGQPAGQLEGEDTQAGQVAS